MFEAELVKDIEELVYEFENFKLYRVIKENHGDNIWPTSEL